MSMDLKKAFDTIDHNILNMKDENMGLKRIVINWPRSNLNNRKEYVKLTNNKCSLRDLIVFYRGKFLDLCHL